MFKMFFKCFLLFISLFSVLQFFIAQSFAITLNVPSVDYPTIQSAIDAASNYDIILVADGTYTENLNVNKTIDIISENGSGLTAIVASDSSDHVINITASHVYIAGFTIAGASINSCALSNSTKAIGIPKNPPAP